MQNFSLCKKSIPVFSLHLTITLVSASRFHMGKGDAAKNAYHAMLTRQHIPETANFLIRIFSYVIEQKEAFQGANVRLSSHKSL